MKKLLENKKMIIVAICVIVFGLLAIKGLKVLIDKITTPKSEKYSCVTTVKNQTNTFDIVYKNGKPDVIKFSLLIEGEKEFNEDGTKNESEARKTYEQQAQSMYLTYDSFKKVNGYQVNLKEENGIATGTIIVDYDLVKDKDISGLYAKRDEKSSSYIKRLEKYKYTCSKEKK